jgi:hypothetical protein
MPAATATTGTDIASATCKPKGIFVLFSIPVNDYILQLDVI